MRGLQGVRVIVLDDQSEEALPVLKALAKKGISAAFYDADPDGFPQNQLTGVRLAILDMDLLGSGGTDKNMASAVLGCVKGILSPENGPYILLAWTMHPEVVAQVEDYVFKDDQIPKPIFSLDLTKDQCKDEQGNITLSAVSEKINQKLSEFSPLFFLQQWERNCFLAATDVTNHLSGLAELKTGDRKEFADHWKKELLQLLHALGQTHAGKNLIPENCLSSICEAMGPLYADRMESYVSDPSSFSIDPGEVLATSSDFNQSAKGRINSMYHLALRVSHLFGPGNLYLFANHEVPQWMSSTQSIFEDIAQPGHEEALQRTSFMILVEIGPNCDHAQQNIRLARFIPGILLPEGNANKIKKNAEFLWSKRPFFIDKPPIMSGDYLICLSARHFITTDLQTAGKMVPYARLRSQILTDLQTWFARHASRPGMLLL
ncbi:MAG: hypothetical protein ABSF52_24010 [Syntrophobacteraceae bacterium]|jgi:hypothetical protein